MENRMNAAEVQRLMAVPVAQTQRETGTDLQQLDQQTQLEQQRQTLALERHEWLEDYVETAFDQASLTYKTPLFLLQKKPNARAVFENFLARIRADILTGKVRSRDEAVIALLDDIEKLSLRPQRAKRRRLKTRETILSVTEKQLPEFWPTYEVIAGIVNQPEKEYNDPMAR